MYTDLLEFLHSYYSSVKSEENDYSILTKVSQNILWNNSIVYLNRPNYWKFDPMAQNKVTPININKRTESTQNINCD